MVDDDVDGPQPLSPQTGRKETGLDRRRPGSGQQVGQDAKVIHQIQVLNHRPPLLDELLAAGVGGRSARQALAELRRGIVGEAQEDTGNLLGQHGSACEPGQVAFLDQVRRHDQNLPFSYEERPEHASRPRCRSLQGQGLQESQRSLCQVDANVLAYQGQVADLVDAAIQPVLVDAGEQFLDRGPRRLTENRGGKANGQQQGEKGFHYFMVA